MSNPVIRSASLHGITFFGGMTAAIAFMASHSVDLYSIYDQLNTTIAAVSKLVAMIAPFISMGYAAWRATTANKVKDIAAASDTAVSPDGKTITLITPKLQEAAKEAATPPLNLTV